MSDTDDEWPLTGRDDELAHIAAALEGQGGIVLAGAAGVGKTRLGRSALAGCQGRHGVRWVLATESSRGIPLGAFLPLLGGVPEHAEAALTAAQRALRDAGTVVVVDDAHLLDDVSATLLLQLALERACRVVVTVRSEERAPDAVTALWKNGVLPRLEIDAIGEAATTVLLERVLGGRVQSTAARRLYVETEGNVLWLRHLVEGERAAGRLRCAEGVWHWVGEPRLGPALSALIDERVGALAPRPRQVLELLALGEPLDVDLLRGLSGELYIEECADRGLVTVVRHGVRWLARLAHPLYGEVVRARMSVVRARRLRGRLVEALGAASEERDRLRLAVLALDSDLPVDPELFLAAANTASLLTDMDLTERLVVAARDAGAGFDAQLLHGFVLSYIFRGEEAEREYVSAATQTGDDAARLRLAQARVLNLSLVIGRPVEGAAVLDACVGCSGARTELLGIRALLAVADNRLAEGRASGQRALETPGVSGPCESYAAWALSMATALGGGPDLSSVAARGTRALLRSPETILLRLNLAWWEALGLGLAGQVEETRLAIERLNSSMSGRFQTSFHPNFAGWLALITGQIDTAVALLAEFRPYFPGHGGGWTSMLELRLALAYGLAGQAAGVRQALARAEEFRHPAITALQPQAQLCQAWLAASESATSSAIRQARDAAALAAASGQLAIEVLARHSAVSFGDRGQAVRLADLARRLKSPRARAAARHAIGWARQDPVVLLGAASLFASAGLMLGAAEAAAQALVVARRRVEPTLSVAASGLLAEFRAECLGARTPALLAATQPLPISDRQREIAGMVAAHLSNREIAERLGVSVRTVEGHVYHACTKLGVANRAELGRLFS